MTLSEIGTKLDLTSERVRQIKNSALKKLSKTGLSALNI
jgi:DNA-directed RNA polymerase sigma subunit (sigma70/sigma32)